MSVEISVSSFVLSDVKSLACIVVHDSFLFSFFGVWRRILIQFLSEANSQWFSLELICTMSS
jgi:hypothetical protein